MGSEEIDINRYIEKCHKLGNKDALAMSMIIKKGLQVDSGTVKFDDEIMSWISIPRQCEPNTGYMRYIFYFDSLSDIDQLKNILDEHIPFNKIIHIRFGAVAETAKLALKELSESHNYTFEDCNVKTNIFYIEKTNYYAKRESAASQVLPPGYKFRDLSPDDASTIAAQWPFSGGNYPGFTLHDITQQLRHIISVNMGVGLTWRGHDDDEEILVGAIIEDYLGCLGRLFVLPEHQCRGFGSHLVEEILRQMFLDKEFVFAFITTGNLLSRRLFHKLGFCMLPGLRCWYHCEKKSDN